MAPRTIRQFTEHWAPTLPPDERDEWKRRTTVIWAALDPSVEREQKREQVAAGWLTHDWIAAWYALQSDPADDLPVKVAARFWWALKPAGDDMNAAAVYDAVRDAAAQAVLRSGWAAAYSAAAPALDAGRATWAVPVLRATLLALDGDRDPWRPTGVTEFRQMYGRHYTAAHERLQPVVDRLRPRARGLLDDLVAV